MNNIFKIKVMLGYGILKNQTTVNLFKEKKCKIKWNCKNFIIIKGKKCVFRK